MHPGNKSFVEAITLEHGYQKVNVNVIIMSNAFRRSISVTPLKFSVFDICEPCIYKFSNRTFTRVLTSKSRLCSTQYILVVRILGGQLLWLW